MFSVHITRKSLAAFLLSPSNIGKDHVLPSITLCPISFRNPFFPLQVVHSSSMLLGLQLFRGFLEVKRVCVVTDLVRFSILSTSKGILCRE